MPARHKLTFARTTSQRITPLSGYSVIELLVVCAIIIAVAAIAVPSVNRALQSYRASSSARNIANELALAKMTAAENFTQTELNCNLNGNSCQLELCTAKGAGSCTTFTNQGGPVLLSQGMSFGFGNVTTPAGTQSTVQNTSPIIFNSRGIPVNNTGTPTGNYAIYLADQSGDTYAVTVYLSGKVTVWSYVSGAWDAL